MKIIDAVDDSKVSQGVGDARACGCRTIDCHCNPATDSTGTTPWLRALRGSARRAASDPVAVYTSAGTPWRHDVTIVAPAAGQSLIDSRRRCSSITPEPLPDRCSSNPQVRSLCAGRPTKSIAASRWPTG